MSISEPFIRRPVATSLLTAAVLMAGVLGYTKLPVAPLPQMYDVGDSILAQKIAQIDGIGQVFVGGSSRPGVRVELNPLLLSRMNVGIDAVRTALSSANANRPKGSIHGSDDAWVIRTNDQLFKARQY